jgi:DNA-binding response OmpR family regulator
MHRILYVEDNDDNVALLSLRLEIEGFEVLSAQDGRAGVALALAEHPDLVIMDLDLPGIDGWEATRSMRAEAAVARIPVIALSAHAMPEHRDLALRAGCDDYEPKPVDFSRLLAKIRRLLGDVPAHPG